MRRNGHKRQLHTLSISEMNSLLYGILLTVENERIIKSDFKTRNSYTAHWDPISKSTRIAHIRYQRPISKHLRMPKVKETKISSRT